MAWEEETTEREGFYELDLRDVRDREEFHDQILRTIPCYSYYGRNLDAFFDVLSAPDRLVDELVIRNFEGFAEAMPEYWTALRVMCGEAEERCGVLIRFEGQNDAKPEENQ
ncbi:MAG: barstar family protein [Clostridium sp.]|nr:barstar family protein [Acetatifactor muris]MCM1526305.1 barstar family protein [Bacteroides sp.]MCM1562878.1 barstar family protein [Clostridium sp.]